jgi:hypothetical protein
MAKTTVHLVGQPYYGASRAFADGRLCAGASLVLLAQPDNPEDENVVAVVLGIDGPQLGYLNRQIAPRYREILLDGRLQSAAVREAIVKDTGYLSVAITIEYQNEPTPPIPLKLPWADLPDRSGVYVVANVTEGRVYIGSSVNIRSRIRAHARALAAGVHANIPMQRAYSAQQGDGFQALVLKEIPPAQRLEEEKRAIQAACALGTALYNLTSDGDGNRGVAVNGPADDPIPITDRNRSGERDRSSDAGKGGQRPPLTGTTPPRPPVEQQPGSAGDQKSNRNWLLWIVGGVLVLWFLLTR